MNHSPFRTFAKIAAGSPTYLVSPVDFAQNPATLFLSLSRYKVKDTYATAQMLDHAMSSMPGKGFSLQELKNLMIASDTRPRLDICKPCALIACRAAANIRTIQTQRYADISNRLVLNEHQSIQYIPTS